MHPKVKTSDANIFSSHHEMEMWIQQTNPTGQSTLAINFWNNDNLLEIILTNQIRINIIQGVMKISILEHLLEHPSNGQIGCIKGITNIPAKSFTDYILKSLKYHVKHNGLTLSQTSPGFYVSAVQAFWKHCGKRRNCS